MILVWLHNSDRSMSISEESGFHSSELVDQLDELRTKIYPEDCAKLGNRKAFDKLKEEVYRLANDPLHLMEKEEDDEVILYKIKLM